MGAEVFVTSSKGTTAQEAFRRAVEHASYMHGHGGYSGTIAEKDSFVIIPVPSGISPSDYVDQLISEGDTRISDKWGPAGCIKLGENEYVFFGWASS